MSLMRWLNKRFVPVYCTHEVDGRMGIKRNMVGDYHRVACMNQTEIVLRADPPLYKKVRGQKLGLPVRPTYEPIPRSTARSSGSADRPNPAAADAGPSEPAAKRDDVSSPIRVCVWWVVGGVVE